MTEIIIAHVLPDQLRPNQPTTAQLIPIRIGFRHSGFPTATAGADRPTYVRRPTWARRCHDNIVLLPLPQKITSFLVTKVSLEGPL